MVTSMNFRHMFSVFCFSVLLANVYGQGLFDNPKNLAEPLKWITDGANLVSGLFGLNLGGGKTDFNTTKAGDVLEPARNRLSVGGSDDYDATKAAMNLAGAILPQAVQTIQDALGTKPSIDTLKSWGINSLPGDPLPKPTPTYNPPPLYYDNYEDYPSKQPNFASKPVYSTNLKRVAGQGNQGFDHRTLESKTRSYGPVDPSSVSAVQSGIAPNNRWSSGPSSGDVNRKPTLNNWNSAPRVYSNSIPQSTRSQINNQYTRPRLPSEILFGKGNDRDAQDVSNNPYNNDESRGQLRTGTNQPNLQGSFERNNDVFRLAQSLSTATSQELLEFAVQHGYNINTLYQIQEKILAGNFDSAVGSKPSKISVISTANPQSINPSGSPSVEFSKERKQNQYRQPSRTPSQILKQRASVYYNDPSSTGQGPSQRGPVAYPSNGRAPQPQSRPYPSGTYTNGPSQYPQRGNPQHRYPYENQRNGQLPRKQYAQGYPPNRGPVGESPQQRPGPINARINTVAQNGRQQPPIKRRRRRKLTPIERVAPGWDPATLKKILAYDSPFVRSSLTLFTPAQVAGHLAKYGITEDQITWFKKFLLSGEGEKLKWIINNAPGNGPVIDKIYAYFENATEVDSDDYDFDVYDDYGDGIETADSALAINENFTHPPILNETHHRPEDLVKILESFYPHATPEKLKKAIAAEEAKDRAEIRAATVRAGALESLYASQEKAANLLSRRGPPKELPYFTERDYGSYKVPDSSITRLQHILSSKEFQLPENNQPETSERPIYSIIGGFEPALPTAQITNAPNSQPSTQRKFELGVAQKARAFVTGAIDQSGTDYWSLKPTRKATKFEPSSGLNADSASLAPWQAQDNKKRDRVGKADNLLSIFSSGFGEAPVEGRKEINGQLDYTEQLRASHYDQIYESRLDSFKEFIKSEETEEAAKKNQSQTHSRLIEKAVSRLGLELTESDREGLVRELGRRFKINLPSHSLTGKYAAKSANITTIPFNDVADDLRSNIHWTNASQTKYFRNKFNNSELEIIADQLKSYEIIPAEQQFINDYFEGRPLKTTQNPQKLSQEDASNLQADDQLEDLLQDVLHKRTHRSKVQQLLQVLVDKGKEVLNQKRKSNKKPSEATISNLERSNPFFDSSALIKQLEDREPQLDSITTELLEAQIPLASVVPSSSTNILIDSREQAVQSIPRPADIVNFLPSNQQSVISGDVATFSRSFNRILPKLPNLESEDSGKASTYSTFYNRILPTIPNFEDGHILRPRRRNFENNHRRRHEYIDDTNQYPHSGEIAGKLYAKYQKIPLERADFPKEITAVDDIPERLAQDYSFSHESGARISSQPFPGNINPSEHSSAEIDGFPVADWIQVVHEDDEDEDDYEDDDFDDFDDFYASGEPNDKHEKVAHYYINPNDDDKPANLPSWINSDNFGGDGVIVYGTRTRTQDKEQQKDTPREQRFRKTSSEESELKSENVSSSEEEDKTTKRKPSRRETQKDRLKIQNPRKILGIPEVRSDSRRIRVRGGSRYLDLLREQIQALKRPGFRLNGLGSNSRRIRPTASIIPITSTPETSTTASTTAAQTTTPITTTTRAQSINTHTFLVIPAVVPSSPRSQITYRNPKPSTGTSTSRIRTKKISNSSRRQGNIFHTTDLRPGAVIGNFRPTAKSKLVHFGEDDRSQVSPPSTQLSIDILKALHYASTPSASTNFPFDQIFSDGSEPVPPPCPFNKERCPQPTAELAHRDRLSNNPYTRSPSNPYEPSIKPSIRSSRNYKPSSSKVAPPYKPSSSRPSTGYQNPDRASSPHSGIHSDPPPIYPASPSFTQSGVNINPPSLEPYPPAPNIYPETVYNVASSGGFPIVKEYPIPPRNTFTDKGYYDVKGRNNPNQNYHSPGTSYTSSSPSGIFNPQSPSSPPSPGPYNKYDPTTALQLLSPDSEEILVNQSILKYQYTTSPPQPQSTLYNSQTDYYSRENIRKRLNPVVKLPPSRPAPGPLDLSRFSSAVSNSVIQPPARPSPPSPSPSAPQRPSPPSPPGHPSPPSSLSQINVPVPIKAYQDYYSYEATLSPPSSRSIYSQHSSNVNPYQLILPSNNNPSPPSPLIQQSNPWWSTGEGIVTSASSAANFYAQSALQSVYEPYEPRRPTKNNYSNGNSLIADQYLSTDWGLDPFLSADWVSLDSGWFSRNKKTRKLKNRVVAARSKSKVAAAAKLKAAKRARTQRQRHKLAR